MTLEEAIKHAEEVAVEQDKLRKRYDDASGYTRSHIESLRVPDSKKCEKCAEEHRQLAEWLKDYQRLLKAIDDIIAEFWCYESSMIVNGREYIGIANAVNIVEKHTGKESE